MKICTKCGENKDFKDFNKKKNSRDGFLYNCKKCEKAYRDIYRVENKDKISAHNVAHREEKAIYNANYRKQNKEKLIIKDAAKYQKNKEHIKAINIIYVQQHKEEITAYKSEWYQENKEDLLADRAIYYQENKEEINSKNSAYYYANAQAASERGKNYRTENKEEVAARNALYKKNNPGKMAAIGAQRRAIKLNATPRWLTKAQKLEMQSIYVECARLTKETGIKHHVDHIIPLQGKNVSGLHVPWNLQILTASQNTSKGNRIIL